MLYVGMVILRLDEEAFWDLTPRKYAALLAAHKEWTRLQHGGSSTDSSSTSEQTYIDNIPGW